MAVRHRELPAEGVQFHPESVLTEQGRELLANFLARDAMTSGADLLTRSIDALASGQDLRLEDTAAVLLGDHGRQRVRDPDRRRS